jgi:glycosyltransferase involved in cell wall biosynthesis
LSSLKKILFIFPVVPFPIRANGVSVRYLPVIQYLAEKYLIDIIIIDGGTADLSKVAAMKKFCRNVFIVPDPKFEKHTLISKINTKINFLFPWTAPISFVVNGGQKIAHNIAEFTKGRHYHSLVWVGAYLSPYLFTALKSMSVDRVVVDFIDSPTLWQKRRHKKSLGLSSFQKYECWKTMRWEAKIIKNVSSSIYISAVDVGFIPRYMTSGHPRHVIPNGIWIDSYTSKTMPDIPTPNIGFLGNMGYFPNVEAVKWLYKDVYIPIRKLIPELSLIIIGRDPDKSIQEMGKLPGVIVTGTVDDIWCYINSIDIFVFPLWIGGGLKNKILEAMYAGRAVITTEIGNEGIDAVSGRNIFICSEASDFRSVVKQLLESENERIRIGNAGNKFVVEKFSWENIFKRFEREFIGNDGIL